MRALFASSQKANMLNIPVAFFVRGKEQSSSTAITATVSMASTKVQILLEAAGDMSWEDKSKVLAPEVKAMCEQFEKAQEEAAGTQAFIAQLTKF